VYTSLHFLLALSLSPNGETEDRGMEKKGVTEVQRSTREGKKQAVQISKWDKQE
jgi:hypothetical protein